jgi:uncharacterized protein (TIGR03084 family)
VTPAALVAALLADLREESLVTETLLRPLAPADWDLPTPAPGWTIRDPVTHLAYFDQAAVLAALDPERFSIEASELIVLGEDFPDQVAARFRRMPGADALEWFASARATLIETYSATDPKLRLPWYGPPMSVASAITARLMETWAHTQDIADTLGLTREPANRLRHIAHLGVSTMAFTHVLHGRPVPAGPIRVDLLGPEGAHWTWGPAGAADRISGDAVDFCLVVTQRRHIGETGLRVTGQAARGWMEIAQAFAGRPTTRSASGGPR